MDQYSWSRLFLAHSYMDYKYQPSIPQSPTPHHETVKDCEVKKTVSEEERNQILEIKALVETGQGGVKRNVIKALGILRSVCASKGILTLGTHIQDVYLLFRKE